MIQANHHTLSVSHRGQREPLLRVEHFWTVRAGCRDFFALPKKLTPPKLWFTETVTATLEQVPRERLRLLRLVEVGEEVLIAREGRAVARPSGAPQAKISKISSIWQSCLARFACVREGVSTGRASATSEEILGDLPSDHGPSSQRELDQRIGSAQDCQQRAALD